MENVEIGRNAFMNGLQTLGTNGKVWLGKVTEVFDLKITPFLQKNQFIAGVVFLLATFIVFEIGLKFGLLASKVVPENRKEVRGWIDTGVIGITNLCLFAKMVQYIERANIPLTWVSGALLTVVAVAVRGSVAFEPDNGIPQSALPPASGAPIQIPIASSVSVTP